MNINISEAWKYLIQPERINYAIDNLGPKMNFFQTYDCYRKDFTFKNNRNNQIQCSLFIPMKKNDNLTTSSQNLENLKLNCPCVIYCHSQSGNRVEGMFLQEFCIENYYGLCVFDFNSCGKSEGQYVTLGWREQDDLEQLISILTTEYKANQISIWGRSMGAVTAVLYAKRNSMFLSSLVLDSPFSDIQVMVTDIAKLKLKIPKLLTKIALRVMSSVIKSKIHFDILKLKPIEFVKHCTVPCCFIIGLEDELVLPKRIEEMRKVYKGDIKYKLESQGDHSSERETFILNQSFEFIYDRFKKNTHFYKEEIVQQPLYVDNVNDDYLMKLGAQFEQKLQQNISQSNQHFNRQQSAFKPYSSQTFNFDYYQEDNEFEVGQQIDPMDNQEVLNLDDDLNQLKNHGDISEMDIQNLNQNLNDLSKIIRKYQLIIQYIYCQLLCGYSKI